MGFRELGREEIRGDGLEILVLDSKIHGRGAASTNLLYQARRTVQELDARRHSNPVDQKKVGTEIGPAGS
jgi:hypothetical protein